MGSRLIAFAVVAVFLVLAGGVVSAQLAMSARGSGEETQISGETWSPSEGQTTNLSRSHEDNVVYSEQSEVVVTQNDTTKAASGNWSWDETNGTVKAVNGTGLNTSDDAQIAYSVYQPSETQTLLVSLGTMPVRIGGELLILLAFAIVVLAVATVGRGL